MSHLEVYALPSSLESDQLVDDKENIVLLSTELQNSQSIDKFKLLITWGIEGLDPTVTDEPNGFCPNGFSGWLEQFDFNIHKKNTTEVLEKLLSKLHSWGEENFPKTSWGELVPNLNRPYCSVDTLITFTTIAVADKLMWVPARVGPENELDG